MPYHRSRRTQSEQSENFRDYITPNIWPPNSSDYNPFDDYVRGPAKRESDKTPSNTKDKLKARVMAAFNNLNCETVRMACRGFHCLLDTVL